MVRREVSRTTANVSGQEVVERFAVAGALAQRVGLGAQLVRPRRARAQAPSALMRSTRLAYCLNCLPSPRRRARSRIDMASKDRAPGTRRLCGPAPPVRGAGRSVGRRGLVRALRDVRRQAWRTAGAGPRVAPAAALVAVALDLARELVGDQVDRVLDVAGGLLGAQRDALEVQRRLGDLVVGDWPGCAPRTARPRGQRAGSPAWRPSRTGA